MFSDLSDATKPNISPCPFTDSGFSFSNYIDYCKSLIKERRLDLSDPLSANKIIDANAPYELHPKGSNAISCGVLFIHGLWASPFNMKEIAEQLQANGLLCRSILLPGHGTRPSDLCYVSHQDWIEAVRFGINSLKKEVDHVILIGYSAGAALSVYHALQDEKIAGVILMAPAIAVKLMMNLVFEFHSFFQKIHKSNWMYVEEEIDYAKYRSIAFEPALQIYQLSQAVNQLLKTKSLKNPVYIIVSEDDETISSRAAINLFHHSKNPMNQLLLYTNKEEKPTPGIQFRKASYPELSIENLSHVCLSFSKNNFHYGQNGDYPHSSYLSNQVVYGAYNRVIEGFYEPFFKWGLIKRCKRELTYNPDFNFMADEIVKFVFKIYDAAKTSTS